MQPRNLVVVVSGETATAYQPVDDGQGQVEYVPVQIDVVQSDEQRKSTGGKLKSLGAAILNLFL